MSEKPKTEGFRKFWLQRHPELCGRWFGAMDTKQDVFIRFLDTAAAYLDTIAPAEVSDKRQDKIVADERPQLSREQIDDMNSGD